MCQVVYFRSMKKTAEKETAISKTQRLRHSTEGGYARGEETRMRIIDAAIQMFGERGFEGASTRDIAKAAGVNAPALQYYFDNKEGVYRACAEYIADNSWQHFRPVLEAAQAALDAGGDRDTLIEAFGTIQDAVADHLLASYDAQKRRLFIAHEQAGHGPSVLFDIMDRNVKVKMKQVMSELISRITSLPADDPLTIVRIMMLHGQLMVFHAAHKSTMSSIGWDCINEERLAFLKKTVRSHTRVLIDSWTAEQAGKRR
jgi:AcrR family transcriptional regulator